MYLYISDLYDFSLQYTCQRFSNNKKLSFTDAEIMTIYLFVVSDMQIFKINKIHKYAKNHLLSWFPELPGYTAFNKRINRLGETFKLLTNYLITDFMPNDCINDVSLLDSMPIITCSGKRKAKVATEITDKGYNSTKGFYYYGLKLHALAFRRLNQIPFPEQLIFTPASENDLNVFKQSWATIRNRTFFGDKIYIDSDFFQKYSKDYNSEMLTPVKLKKGESKEIRQRDKAANDLFSTAVSRVRQPIESLFNWLIEKTDINKASKVRSTKGLLVHVFGKIASAYISLIF